MNPFMIRAVLAGSLSALWLISLPASTQGVPTLKLPKPKTKGQISLEETIAQRRAVRAFALTTLTDETLGQLLWAAQGLTAPPQHLRAAPSAGATYPLETYLVTAQGIQLYLPQEHALREVLSGDQRAALAAAALDQTWMRKAAAIIILTALPERTTRRYGERGRMYIYMEAGHAAQNVHLQAVALGLGSTPVGAFDEQAIARLLNLPAGQRPLYLLPIGRPQADAAQ